MPDLLIRHLRLRIIRAGSLFWGAEPRALARRALAVLPRLLEEALDGLGPGGSDEVELATPVRLHFRGTLAGMAAGLDPAAPGPDVRSAVREALEVALASAKLAPSAPTRVPPNASEDVTHPRSVLNDLLELYASGNLPARLRAMDDGTVGAYHRVLLMDAGPPALGAPRAASAADLQEAERFVSALAAGFAHGREPGARDERIRERILTIIALAARLGMAPYDPGVRALVQQLLPLEGGQSDGLAPVKGEGAAPHTTAASLPDVPAPILPLLAASLLARTGALTLVARHLEARGRRTDLPLWIAALAFKLGAVPERGWRYSAEVWQSVAAIADCPDLSGEALVFLADDPGADWRALTGDLLGEVRENGIDPVLGARPACALARRPEFESHVSRVAGSVLERLGSLLWPEAGSVGHTLERLDSLEARLRRTRDGMVVRVPLGKRYSDLLRAGLLADIPNAPWLRDGGSIRFYGG